MISGWAQFSPELLTVQHLLPSPSLLWSQLWELPYCREDVPPTGPDGFSPLCFFHAVLCGTGIHSSVHTWHSGPRFLGRLSETLVYAMQPFL